MPRPTRSQKPSQSQPSKRPSRRLAQSDEDEEDEPAQTQGGVDDEDEDVEGAYSQGKVLDDFDRKANDLVRLALFNENRRLPLKRDEITKKVLGSNSRSFYAVLERAQYTLRNVFGMELVELQSRAEREKESREGGKGDGEEGRKATGIKKKSTAVGSKSYILRSTLDPLLIEYAALTDEQILEQEVAEAPSDEDDEDAIESYGSLMAWNSSDQLGSLGILYVILALILVNGRVIADNDLRAVLKQLRLAQNATVSFNNTSTHQSMQINAFLTQLTKQGYLDPSVAGEQKAGGKRTRAPVATQGGSKNGEPVEDGANLQWKWGSRAHSEVGERGIAKFVAEFMVERTATGEDRDGEDAVQRSEEIQRKTLETMMKGIERAAAGGELSDVK